MATSGPARRWLGNLVLLAVSSAVCLLMAEAAARVWRATRGGGKEANERARYTGYDPLLGWSKMPRTQALFHRREYTVPVTVNARGLRDVERSYVAPPGTFRVLALGDSFIEAYTVPLSETVTQVLEARLRERGCRAEVINGGTTGYSTDQEYLFYRAEGARYDPRVVVLFFYYNDVVYNDRQDYFGLPKPAFQIVGDGLRLHRYPVRRRPPEQPAPAAPAAEGEGSALLEWLGERLWHGAPGAYDLLAGLGLWDPMGRAPVRMEMLVYRRRPVAEVEDAWVKTEAILRELAREVSARGARLLVTYVPSPMEVDGRSWRLTRKLYGLRDGEWDRRAVVRRLRHIGGRHGFPVLDLSPDLRARDSYFVQDRHWTALGHRLAAEAVRRRLRELGWLAGCAPAVSPATAARR